ncbi:MAG: hypothetical protein BGO78_01410 [Chloroflexi bacterium 44-23]|nr:MAG: hypothetical protein BGO78_01410 [Chloroflexi bacterium 44-23]
MKVGVIGGGPAGIFAALEAAKRHDAVTLIDFNSAPGRKLAASGAGRGNLTNLNIDSKLYSSIEDFAYSDIIRHYNFTFLASYFKQLGIFIYHTDDGWCYPISNSAKNIAMFLNEVLRMHRVEIRASTYVKDIQYSKGRYVLSIENGESLSFDRLIIAAGGQAHPQLNSSDNLLNVLGKMGHKIITAKPGLAPIKTTKDFSKLLNGVRLDTQLTLRRNHNEVASSTGNIIFTEWGVNGPAAMNLSHYVNEGESGLTLEFNFNNTQTQEVLSTLTQNDEEKIPLSVALLPVFPIKLIDQFTENSKRKNLNLSSPPEAAKSKIANNFNFTEKILGTRGFQYAQISTGAVSSASINPANLESLILPGLFFAGEILDVIGPCGGFNLHWAFVSGIVAGKSV